METIINRIALIINKLDISVRSFEKNIDVSNGTIQKAIANNKTVGSDVLNKILCNYPEISAEWLMRGEGNMLFDSIDINHSNNRNINNTGDFSGVNGDVNITTAKMEHHTLVDEVVFLRGQIKEKDSLIGRLLTKLNL
jgi:hypothetical protein